jgi:hypothetical protein
LVRDSTYECKYKGKSRAIKIAQMNIQILDERQIPVDSWLYEKMEGWEFDPKKKLLRLSVYGIKHAHRKCIPWFTPDR